MKAMEGYLVRLLAQMGGDPDSLYYSCSTFDIVFVYDIYNDSISMLSVESINSSVLCLRFHFNLACQLYVAMFYMN